MTTLAIIGGGIAGRSLLYELSRGNIPFDEVLFFESESFAPACSLRSTAISARRGVTKGHSPLGDLLVDAFETFKQHVFEMRPAGVYPVPLYSGAIEKLEQFRGRYPAGSECAELGSLKLKSPLYIAQEDAFMIDPPVYLDWLLAEASKKLNIKHVKEFITEVTPGVTISLSSQNKNQYQADQLVFATGASSRYWRRLFPESKLKTSKPVQGAYLEFHSVNWDGPSLALSLEGRTLVYHANAQKLLLGSTSQEVSHSLVDQEELKRIHAFFQARLEVALPEFEQGQVKLGHREKAQKREPYIFTEGNISFIGGLYKNGFTLSLEMTRSLSHQLRGPV